MSLSPGGSFVGRHPHSDGSEAPPSPRYSFTDTFAANMGGAVTFEAPELPEETLMEVWVGVGVRGGSEGKTVKLTQLCPLFESSRSTQTRSRAYASRWTLPAV